MGLNFKPIPADVSPVILAAQARSQPPSILDLQIDLKTRTQELLFPDAYALEFFTCSREGLYEIALNSFVQQDVLVCVNGPLSKQWLDISKNMGINISILDENYGNVFSHLQLEKKITEQDFDAICLVEIDPFTGIYNDLPALSAMIRRHLPDAIIIADCSASVSNVQPLKFGVDADIILSCSEISLGLPPGFGLIALDEHANFKALGNPGKGWYLNLNRALLMRNNPGISPIPYPLLYALERQLDEIQFEGIEQKIQRIRQLSETIKTWAASKGFQFLSDPQFTAPNFSVLQSLPQFTPMDLIGFLESYGIVIGSCPGEMKDTFFVIAHMNMTTEKDLDHLFFAMNRFLSDYDTRRSIPKSNWYNPVKKIL